MVPNPLDHQLRRRLLDISEIGAAGFSVREGLTGAGVTVLKGRSYFGSWRLSQGQLVFVPSNIGEPHFLAENVDDAIRHTMLMILRSLQAAKHVYTGRAVS
jgi:hypothetical protein